ncbi:MAG: TRAP transporter TatT component family protein [Elusimicrobia bacterium]|nr:TRAP transporter TatT component family protein [Elusimicrobiota bacterium]
MKKIALLIPLFSLCSCSINSIALRSTAELMDRGVAAYYEESDPQLARDAMASQLKFIEGLLRSEPSNPRLNRLAAEGFGSYAFLFVEDAQPDRAKSFYLRGRDYALRSLAGRPGLAGLSAMLPDALEQSLRNAQKADAPPLFWAAFCWSGFINLSKDSPDAVAELPKAVALMKRSHELDPDYNFAGSDLFFGVYFASRPKLLGGNPEKAKEHFKWAERLTEGKYLMTFVLEAKTLAVALQDRALFESLLAKVKDEPAGRLPDARLADEVAKLKAAALKEKIDDLF